MVIKEYLLDVAMNEGCSSKKSSQKFEEAVTKCLKKLNIDMYSAYREFNPNHESDHIKSFNSN